MSDVLKPSKQLVPFGSNDKEISVQVTAGELGVAFVNANALRVLNAPVPKEIIKKREGPYDPKTGKAKMLDYIPHGWYRARLNEAFGFDWDWIRDDVIIDLVNNSVVFYGHLVIRVRNPLTGELLTTITKSGEGGAPILRYSENHKKYPGAVIDLANDVKIASSDALKRACLNLGLGLDLYWKDDIDDAEEDDEEEGKAPSGAGKQPVVQAQPQASKPVEVQAQPQVVEGEHREIPVCSDCGQEITGGVSKSGAPFTAEKMIKQSMERYQKPLCIECYRKRKAAETKPEVQIEVPPDQVLSVAEQIIKGVITPEEAAKKYPAKNGNGK